MSCPFHNYLRRNPQCKCITDKRSTTSVCSKQGIFRCNFINALSLTYRLINTCQFSQFFKIIVHFLVSNNRQHLVIFKCHILVFIKNCFTMVVQLNNQAIRSLNRCNLNVVAFYITSTKIKHIGVTQPREALKEKKRHVLDLKLAWQQVSRTLGVCSIPPM